MYMHTIKLINDALESFKLNDTIDITKIKERIADNELSIAYFEKEIAELTEGARRVEDAEYIAKRQGEIDWLKDDILRQNDIIALSENETSRLKVLNESSGGTDEAAKAARQEQYREFFKAYVERVNIQLHALTDNLQKLQHIQYSYALRDIFRMFADNDIGIDKIKKIFPNLVDLDDVTIDDIVSHLAKHMFKEKVSIEDVKLYIVNRMIFNDRIRNPKSKKAYGLGNILDNVVNESLDWGQDEIQKNVMNLAKIIVPLGNTATEGTMLHALVTMLEDMLFVVNRDQIGLASEFLHTYEVAVTNYLSLSTIPQIKELFDNRMIQIIFDGENFVLDIDPMYANLNVVQNFIIPYFDRGMDAFGWFRQSDLDNVVDQLKNKSLQEFNAPLTKKVYTFEQALQRDAEKILKIFGTDKFILKDTVSPVIFKYEGSSIEIINADGSDNVMWVYDTETTGVNFDSRVLQIALIKVTVKGDGTVIVDPNDTITYMVDKADDVIIDEDVSKASHQLTNNDFVNFRNQAGPGYAGDVTKVKFRKKEVNFGSIEKVMEDFEKTTNGSLLWAFNGDYDVRRLVYEKLRINQVDVTDEVAFNAGLAQYSKDYLKNTMLDIRALDLLHMPKDVAGSKNIDLARVRRVDKLYSDEAGGTAWYYDRTNRVVLSDDEYNTLVAEANASGGEKFVLVDKGERYLNGNLNDPLHDASVDIQLSANILATDIESIFQVKETAIAKANQAIRTQIESLEDDIKNYKTNIATQSRRIRAMVDEQRGDVRQAKREINHLETSIGYVRDDIRKYKEALTLDDPMPLLNKTDKNLVEAGEKVEDVINNRITELNKDLTNLDEIVRRNKEHIRNAYAAHPDNAIIAQYTKSMDDAQKQIGILKDEVVVENFVLHKRPADINALGSNAFLSKLSEAVPANEIAGYKNNLIAIYNKLSESYRGTSDDFIFGSSSDRMDDIFIALDELYKRYLMDGGKFEDMEMRELIDLRNHLEDLSRIAKSEAGALGGITEYPIGISITALDDMVSSLSFYTNQLESMHKLIESKFPNIDFLQMNGNYVNLRLAYSIVGEDFSKIMKVIFGTYHIDYPDGMVESNSAMRILSQVFANEDVASQDDIIALKEIFQDLYDSAAYTINNLKELSEIDPKLIYLYDEYMGIVERNIETMQKQSMKTTVDATARQFLEKELPQFIAENLSEEDGKHLQAMYKIFESMYIRAYKQYEAGKPVLLTASRSNINKVRALIVDNITDNLHVKHPMGAPINKPSSIPVQEDLTTTIKGNILTPLIEMLRAPLVEAKAYKRRGNFIDVNQFRIDNSKYVDGKVSVTYETAMMRNNALHVPKQSKMVSKSQKLKRKMMEPSQNVFGGIDPNRVYPRTMVDDTALGQVNAPLAEALGFTMEFYVGNWHKTEVKSARNASLAMLFDDIMAGRVHLNLANPVDFNLVRSAMNDAKSSLQRLIPDPKKT